MAGNNRKVTIVVLVRTMLSNVAERAIRKSTLQKQENP